MQCKRSCQMISFAPLFKYMAEHEIKPNHLVLAGVCDSGTIYRLHHNKNTSMAMIEKIMDFLNCDLKDVMEWIPDEDAAEHDKIQKNR